MRFCFYVSAAAAAAVFHFHLICVAVAVAFVGSFSHPRIVSRKTNGFTSSTAPNKCATMYILLIYLAHRSFIFCGLYAILRCSLTICIIFGEFFRELQHTDDLHHFTGSSFNLFRSPLLSACLRLHYELWHRTTLWHIYLYLCLLVIL